MKVSRNAIYAEAGTLAQMLARGAQLFAELATSDLEAAHGRTVLLGVVGGGRSVLALDLVKLGAGGADLLVQCTPLGARRGSNPLSRA